MYHEPNQQLVDFYIASAKLVFKLDGSQHYGKEELVTDQKMDLFLFNLVIHILQFSNLDVNRNFNGGGEILKYL